VQASDQATRRDVSPSSVLASGHEGHGQSGITGGRTSRHNDAGVANDIWFFRLTLLVLRPHCRNQLVWLMHHMRRVVPDRTRSDR
jgi:hypothetical protein